MPGKKLQETEALTVPFHIITCRLQEIKQRQEN
jgi:hypothetical protein